MSIDGIKSVVEPFLRSLFGKVLTRFVMYVLTAWLGVEAGQAESTATTWGLGILSAASFAIAVLIDKAHQKADRKASDGHAKA